jgi:sulfite exporter TauE/SafE
MNIDLLALLAIGFTVGFSHCIGMCGGFVLSYTLKVNQNDFIEKPTVLQSLLPHLLYNSGRVISYMVLGQFVGFIGMILGGVFKSFQGGIEIFAGIVMVLMGLDFLGYIKGAVFENFPGISHFKQFVQNLFNGVKRKNILGLGFVMGFIPCGPVYAALAKSAAAANILDSMLSMLFFGLGTFPAMILTGLFADKITTKLRKNVYKVAAILILLLGVFTIVRGIVKIIKFTG